MRAFSATRACGHLAIVYVNVSTGADGCVDGEACDFPNLCVCVSVHAYVNCTSLYFRHAFYSPCDSLLAQ